MSEPTTITHAQAFGSAQRLINSHFHQEPSARIGIPARPDYDDDLIITRYIEQQAALAQSAPTVPAERVLALAAHMHKKAHRARGVMMIMSPHSQIHSKHDGRAEAYDDCAAALEALASQENTDG